MKKLLLSLLMLAACTIAEAKVIKITLTDGSVKVFTSSQLSYIDFNDDGTLTICTYDGKELPALAADFNELAVNDEAFIYETFTDTLRFNIDVDGVPVNLNSDRPITKMNYVYPGTDPAGEPITLSGTILIPEEIMSGKERSEGILMINHYTRFSSKEASTLSNGELENMFLANPLKPNYIIVESDNYGFGVTERFPQPFLQGDANARSSLDGLLAARKLLEARGFDYGPLCFNIGYSSGGYDAMASQKLRDKEYADRITFDKTFSGGGPMDICEAYRQYVTIDRTAYNAVPLLLMVATNETQKLGISYSDVFQPNIANRVDKLILSKAYSSWPVCDSIGREKLVHEILSETYSDLESPQSKAMQEVLRRFNMTNDDWTPDLSQRIYLYHSRGDDYVPIKCSRPMIAFLKSKGFEPSIIPGRTNFQTNFVVRNLGHLTGTAVFFVQSLAAIKAWPLMYENNQLNPVYQDLVGKELGVKSILLELEAAGLDCKKFIREVESMLDQTDLTQLVEALIGATGYTKEELVEVCEDSGLDIKAFLAELVAYLHDADANAGESVEESLVAPATPTDVYSRQLREWLEPAMR
ncbi:MAG: hypothetical protein IJ607_04615 [Bacteroidaceae bacterium]|nr:hypothetical protein [Bacteroidaceae bacterium]